MRIHRLIPIVVVLFILAATTMTTVQHRLIGVESVAAQQSPVQSDGTSSVVAQDTSDKVDTDLYLDADEVERRAAEEQASDSVVSAERPHSSFVQTRTHSITRWHRSRGGRSGNQKLRAGSHQAARRAPRFNAAQRVPYLGRDRGATRSWL